MTSNKDIRANAASEQGQQSPLYAGYPQIRMRRLRGSGWIRDMVQETRLQPSDLIWPCFVADDPHAREPIASMPGAERLGLHELLKDIRQAADLGINTIALFPVTPPEKKNDAGDEALNPDNLMCRTLREVKARFPEIGLIADVALDPYTAHGHDGLCHDGKILNDETVEVLCRQAVLQAESGADIIAPSDMMDGRIGAIRRALDQEHLSETLILSYAAKYASGFYGPFREAVGSASVLKTDKKAYQMNPANILEALREVELDLREGADMVMVKPGMPYLDVIAAIKNRFAVPTFAYQVSGEFAMLKAAAQNGWLDYESCLIESLMALKRGGCNGILTYGARDAAQLLSRTG